MLFISCFFLSLHTFSRLGARGATVFMGEYAKVVYVNTPKFAILHWFNLLNLKNMLTISFDVKFNFGKMFGKNKKKMRSPFWHNR